MPRNSSSLPDLPPEKSGSRKPVGIYIVAYGAIIMLILGLLSWLLAIPTSSH